MSGIIFSKESGVNDSIFGKSQEPIKAIIMQSVESFQEKSLIDKIFYMDKSKNHSEKYTTETALGDFSPVGENGAYPETGFQEGFAKAIEPDTWKSQFAVTQEMVEDSKIGKIKSRAKQFTLSYNRTRERFGASLLAAGIKKTVTFGGKEYDATCADKTALFNPAHPSATKGGKHTQSKSPDDDGNLLNVMPDTIIIPNSGAMKRAVFAAVGSELDPDSSNNAWNFQVGLWNVLVWNYLPPTMSGKPYFFMADSQFLQDYMCLPWIDRVPLAVRSYINNNTDANVLTGRARFGAGFNNWRGIALCGEGFSEGTALS